MKEVTATAATVEEAVELALAQLGVPRERANIVVIDEGKKVGSACLVVGRRL